MTAGGWILDPAIVNMILKITVDNCFLHEELFNWMRWIFLSKNKLILPNWDLVTGIFVKTSVAGSTDALLPIYDFQRTEESCPNVATLVVYLRFYSKTRFQSGFQWNNLETQAGKNLKNAVKQKLPQSAPS